MHALALEAIDKYPTDINALVNHISSSLAITHPKYAINTDITNPTEWVFNKFVLIF